MTTNFESILDARTLENVDWVRERIAYVGQLDYAVVHGPRVAIRPTRVIDDYLSYRDPQIVVEFTQQRWPSGANSDR